MDTRRFFSEKIGDSSELELKGEEAYHLKKVLRVKLGTEIEVTDGKGLLCIGEVESLKGEVIKIKILKREFFNKPENKIILAPSLLKRNQMNLLIEKLSEIGVDEIIPILFNRTELKASEKSIDKWLKIIIASLKVNKKVWLTKINHPIKFSKFIENYKNFDNKLMLDIEGENKDIKCGDGNTVVVIGPPGDFIDSERSELIENGFERVKINSSILKVETAAISISAILKKKQFDLGMV